MDTIIRHHEDVPRERLIQLIWQTAAAQGVYDCPPSQSQLEAARRSVEKRPQPERRWHW
jgi:hypothetical protein